jgi:uracil-DNA glycosylase
MGQSIDLHPSWLEHLKDEFQTPRMKGLKNFLSEEISRGKIIFPRGSEIFRCFSATPFEKVKVVILGQDPYHGEGEAHGLCFSVQQGIKIPPSLQNIFKELSSDLNVPMPSQGNLLPWANEGVLLLNTVLTVEKDKPLSHRGKGWEEFTDTVVQALSQKKENLVFILWGSHALKKGQGIDPKKHCIIHSPHPSPLSSYRGFFGSRPFSKTNEYLSENGIPPIQWEL